LVVGMTKKSLKDKKSKANSSKKGKSDKNKHPVVYNGLKHQAKVQKNVEKHINGETVAKEEIKIEIKTEEIVNLAKPHYKDYEKVKYNPSLENNLRQMLETKTKEIPQEKKPTQEENEKHSFYLILLEFYGFNKNDILVEIEKLEDLNFQNLYKSLTKEDFDFDEEEIEELKNDETLVLESIFENQFEQKENEISIRAKFEIYGTVIWKFIIEDDSLYPMEFPKLEIDGKFNDKQKYKLTNSVYKFAVDNIGMPMIHSMVTYLEENINRILNEEDKSENRLNSYLKEVNNSKYSYQELNNPWKMGTLERKSIKKEIQYQEKTISEKEEKILQIDEEILKKRKELPSYKMKNEILKLIENNQVTIISGSTGCGKSTQVFFCFLNLDSTIHLGFKFKLQCHLYTTKENQCNLRCRKVNPTFL
jgi:hypothetical protein